MYSMPRNEPGNIYNQCARRYGPAVFCLLFLYLQSSFADILVLNSRDSVPYQEFTSGLKELAHSTVQVVQIDNDMSQIETLMRDINPEKVVALTSPIAQYLHQKNIPNSYFSMISNAHTLKLSRMTGVELNADPQQYLATTRRLLPNVQRVGVMYSADNIDIIEQAKNDAAQHNLILVTIQINNTAEIYDAMQQLLTGSDAIWLINDPIVTYSAKIVKDLILLTAIKANKPIFGLNKWAVKNGALFCLSADYKEVGKQLSVMMQRPTDEHNRSYEYPRDTRLIINHSMSHYFNNNIDIMIPKDALIIK